MKKPHLPVQASKLPRLMGDGIGPRTETCINWSGPIDMVPFLHQGNVYIQRKLHVWRVQKYIPLVGAETALTCAGRQTTPTHRERYRAKNGSLRKFGLTYRHGPCLHQINIYIQRNLRVWREQKCIPLVGGETPLTCVGRQTAPSH